MLGQVHDGMTSPSIAKMLNGSVHSQRSKLGHHQQRAQSPPISLKPSLDLFASLHDTSQELSRSSVPRLRTPPTQPPSSTCSIVPAVEGGDSPREALASLALLAVLSLLLAFLSVLFLAKVMNAAAATPGGGVKSRVCGGNLSSLGVAAAAVDEYRLVSDVVVALTSCTLALDFVCLLICCAQFLFASKLLKATPSGSGGGAYDRVHHFLRRSSFTRLVAVGGFFVSIPVLLTGIVLHAFVRLEARPAVITGAMLCACVVFCGLALVHNAYVWHRSKVNGESPQKPTETHLDQLATGRGSNNNASLELSTLV